MATVIRMEQAGDAYAIGALVETAFRTAPHSDGNEHRIVAALRDAGQLVVSLVAQADADITGHIALSPVMIEDGAADWYGLGPLAVAPQRQGQGLGTRLVNAALAELRRRSARGCVVLGDPRFYARFGFIAAPALRFPGVPAEYFQSLRLADAQASGIVTYAAAFYAACGD